MLDLGQIPAALTVQPNTNVSFESLVFQNATPSYYFPTGMDSLDEAAGLAIWPSVVVQPNTTVRAQRSLSGL